MGLHLDLGTRWWVLPAWQPLVDDVVQTIDRHLHLNGLDVSRAINVTPIEDGVAHAAKNEMEQAHDCVYARTRLLRIRLQCSNGQSAVICPFERALC